MLLTESHARRRNIHLGERIPFATPTGIRDLRVRGLLHAEGLATVFGGNLAVMDSFAAQRLLAKERSVDHSRCSARAGAPRWRAGSPSSRARGGAGNEVTRETSSDVGRRTSCLRFEIGANGQ